MLLVAMPLLLVASCYLLLYSSKLANSNAPVPSRDALVTRQPGGCIHDFELTLLLLSTLTSFTGFWPRLKTFEGIPHPYDRKKSVSIEILSFGILHPPKTSSRCCRCPNKLGPLLQWCCSTFWLLLQSPSAIAHLWTRSLA